MSAKCRAKIPEGTVAVVNTLSSSHVPACASTDFLYYIYLQASFPLPSASSVARLDTCPSCVLTTREAFTQRVGL